jgi:hypothetical protein
MFGQFLIGAFADTRLLAHCFTPNAVLAGLADTTVERRCFLDADHTSFFASAMNHFLCVSPSHSSFCFHPFFSQARSINNPNLCRIL